MATDSVDFVAGYAALGTGANTRAGQRLTISLRSVSKLSFYLLASGTPTGDITHTIRKVSDSSIIVSKVLADASTISAVAFTGYEVTFGSSTPVNEEVRILCEWAGSGAGDHILVGVGGFVKDNALETWYDGSWHDHPTGQDMAYIYTYTAGSAPVITTQAVTEIIVTTATGNGNITTLGSPAPTAYGVCWNTTGTPTVADDKTDEGAASATGAFTTSMTGLLAETLYYVKAYATSVYGTVYGAEVNFTTYATDSPIVTTQAVSQIIDTTATGNGNVTGLGAATVTQHGHCWDTTVDPTTTDSASGYWGKTQNGTAYQTGHYTSAMTSLTKGTLYYVRAYATNSYGTVYGDNVTFTTDSVVGSRYLGVVGKQLRYYDEYGTLRILEGYEAGGF